MDPNDKSERKRKRQSKSKRGTTKKRPYAVVNTSRDPFLICAGNKSDEKDKKTAEESEDQSIKRETKTENASKKKQSR